MDAVGERHENAFAGLTRDNLPDYAVRRLRSGGGTRPDLVLLEDRGVRAVLKDYRAAGWLVRTWVGPWLIGREERIYRILDGIEGVPRLLGRLDRHAFLVEHIEGTSCARLPNGALPPGFFDRLQRVVDAIHARGVVHCDLKNRSNIVSTEDLRPHIVDFASAFTAAGRLGALRRFAYDRFLLDDNRAVVKARIHVGNGGTAGDRASVSRRDPAERIVRGIRDAARWAFQLIAGR